MTRAPARGLAGLLAAGLLAGAAAANPADGAPLRGTARVVDADTLVVAGARVRLEGIDAPESGQDCAGPDGRKYACGREAAQALRAHIGSRPVACSGAERDRYGRRIMTCKAAGENLNRWLVRSGHALAYRRYSRRYVPDENYAKARRLGVWRGAFVPPWEWRRGRRG